MELLSRQQESKAGVSQMGISYIVTGMASVFPFGFGWTICLRESVKILIQLFVFTNLLLIDGEGTSSPDTVCFKDFAVSVHF